MGLLFSKQEEFDFAAELAKQTDLQSVIVGGEGEEAKGLGPIRRNIRFKDALLDTPWMDDEKKEGCDTLWKCFQRGVATNGDGNMLGTRTALGDEKFGDYVWTSYNDVNTETLEVGAGLRTLGLNKGDTVGICGVNTHPWVATALALYGQGLVTVALYDTFGEEALAYIIDHAECRVVCSSFQKLPLILQSADDAKSMKYIVVFDEREGEEVTDEIREQGKAKGVEIVAYSELRAKGREAGAKADPPSPEDNAFYMYTSGTTGMPKGVVLTHKNITACVAGFITTSYAVQQDDILFSYLPLAHIFETAVQAACWGAGASIGFYSGHVKRLTVDLIALRPTLFPGVPRVFSKIYDKLMEMVPKGGAVKAMLFNKSMAHDARLVRRGQPLNNSGFTQATVFAGVRAKLGLDRCRLCVTGAAPCPPYLMEFLRVVVNPSAGVVQGYGMTETSAALCTTSPTDHCLGHVGPPLSSCEIRLADVEEMGYTTANNSGEVLGRGPSIFKGYFKNEEATKSTLEEDGWIHTGDIGRWNPNGTLSIIDRKKNLFKLAQGEYIASEKIEGVYGRLPTINQVFVYGNSFKSKIVAVVVPTWNTWDPIFRSKGWWGKDGPAADETNPERSDEYRAHFKKVVEEHEKEIKDILNKEMKEAADHAGLRGFERVADVILEGDIDVLGTGFNVDNECMTPTFKLRRPFLLKRYKDRIIESYAALGEPKKPDEEW